MNRTDYQNLPISKLYELAEQIAGKDAIELTPVIEQLEEIRERFAQRPIDNKPRLRVVWPDG